jgi:hypothetical protein
VSHQRSRARLRHWCQRVSQVHRRQQYQPISRVQCRQASHRQCRVRTRQQYRQASHRPCLRGSLRGAFLDA